MTRTLIGPYVRAQAATGCDYIAPLYKERWFRHKDDGPSGVWVLGAVLGCMFRDAERVEVFDEDEWHPVVGWDPDDCRPAEDCFQEVGA